MERPLFLNVFARQAYIYDRVPLLFWPGFCRNITENYFTHTLQDSIHAEVSNVFNHLRNRGQKRANFHVLRETSMSAFLSENGFIDTKADADFLKKDGNLREIGEAHGKGIAAFFGLSTSSTTKPAPEGKVDSVSGSKPKANLQVDGYWGPATTRALQRYLGTPIDGVISGQYQNRITSAIPAVRYGPKYTGSLVIRALQKKIGASVDGFIGPETVRKLQSYLGTTVDGVISRPSLMVRELQRRLNAGNF